MHSSVQYMMVKMMVHNRNAERVDFNMMMIFFWYIVNVDVFSYQTITCSSLLDNNDVVNLCFFMWRESWTADWGRASEMPTVNCLEMPTVNCFLLLVTSIAIYVLWQGIWYGTRWQIGLLQNILFYSSITKLMQKILSKPFLVLLQKNICFLTKVRPLHPRPCHTFTTIPYCIDTKSHGR